MPTLRLPIATLMIGSIALGCARKPPWQERILEKYTATTAQQFDDAAAADRVMIFFQVDWASESLLSSYRLAEFIRSAERDGTLQDVRLVLVNVSDDSTDLRKHIRAWLEAHQTDVHLVSNGSGDLIWVHRGKVLHTIRHVASYEIQEIEDITTRLKTGAP